uniref:Glutathione S-transferase C-terminal domain-containing protein n=1 Tax=Knipowitschia caucasica TaxID=637954 RepID=A0AAV2L382_KNICA
MRLSGSSLSVRNMAIRELSSLEKYLGLKKPNKYTTQGDKKVPVLQNNDGPPLVGLVTVGCHLVREAKRPELLGDGAEGRALVQQWLEYRVTKVDECSKEDTRTILKELNAYLEDKVYFVGNQITLADFFMYFGTHSLIVGLSVQEREQLYQSCGQQQQFEHQPLSQEIRDGLQSVPLPPLLMLRATAQAERGGEAKQAHQLPHTSSQPRPEPGPLGDRQPLRVISLALPRGEHWREAAAPGRKEHPRAPGSFCDM